MISTYRYFIQSNFDLWTFRKYVFSTFKLFVLGQIYTRSYWFAVFLTFVLFNLMLFRPLNISPLVIWIFRTNNISTFEIFALGNINSRTFCRMSCRHSHFSIFALFNSMLFRSFDISTFGHFVPLLFRFLVILIFVLKDPMRFRPFDISLT